MPFRRFSALLLGLLLPGMTSLAPAQSPEPAPALRAAVESAERGLFDAGQYPGLARDPAYGWVEYALLVRDINTLPAAQAQSFLTRYAGQPVAEAFRELWLAAAARRLDWPSFRAAWAPTIRATTLRCAELNARQATGNTDPQWLSDAQALWRSTGKPLPTECDTPFAVLAARGGLSPDLRWERIDKAAGEWNASVMRQAAQGLPPADFALASDYAAFMEAVNDRALTWPATARSRWMASQGLARLGKSVPLAAEIQLPRYAQALGFSDTERGRVLYQIALWTVASYEPESARRLAAVPASAFDDKLHEWQVREALARSDWRGALAAIRAMPDKQRSDSRWTYFEGRLLELTGDRAGAQQAYQRAAHEPQFHGFLAADRIRQPYALCPWQPNDSSAAKAVIASDPAIVRAMELYRIDRAAWAQREWDDAMHRFDDTQRRLAVEVAQDNGWYDRAVFSLGSKPDELRLYTLRFPLHHDQTIRREAAKSALDPAWVAAEIRAESVFNPRAHSAANAMGLMQLLPGTGMGVARQLGVPWAGADSLYDPDTNITLGAAYLRQLLDKEGGQPYFAIAGYNAGPAPLARWQSQRPGMDPDFWIETISYKETREYVARVLAFSTIYDWRLNGNALPVSDRMRGNLEATRKQFVCPPATPRAN
ncbi:MAG: transglycosylase domain protein [Xanthomonadaceae bacterium]|nr:transglycosylase domain protein [Xanthomonadaceae bacterium]